ncbi:asparagine synthase-related protein [Aquimarina sp. 2201CG5-10]|uniref:asparagine synthase-related protein n=1 Tax=Aquimarina callyspongiae TaxID=3098150 RepID=UPI002AB5B4C6|nr:asparagine synthase-related protein [Aquimarina sp. 2201CG5-10]MDY8136892.1 asparagine synthase-related protein [Aquimarina sp. 2201CG5-10]
MNDFIIVNKDFIHKLSKKESIQLTNDWFLFSSKKNYTEYNITGAKIIIIGDYLDSIQDFFTVADNDIPKQRGHFYAIIIKGNTIKVYNSLFSMLPVYYCSRHCFISSSIDLIKNHLEDQLEIDKKFILENLLFNYGFFNRTLFKQINLLPSHTFITLRNNKIRLSKHISMKDLFVLFPMRGEKTARKLSDLFIETTKKYFPDKPFQVAFTSGFDGRTLVSCATHHQKQFETFSFGRPENDDVTIPQQNSEFLNIPYQYFDLGEESYVQSDYYQNAIEYTSSGYLGNGFLYPHFLYSTKEISKNTNYLISGAAGSELFRALHNTGAVTSQALVDVFKLNDEKEIREALKNAKPLEVLNQEEFREELDELIEEVIAYKQELPSDLSMNQRFYVFVFEEIFRKFFGQWITLQQKYLNVRTPFLDYNFVKELLATGYAGANNDFFTKNPIKRMKGQYLYSDIIRKTNTHIYHQKTGKGYRPIDVRDPRYIHNIILPFLNKRFKRKVAKTNLDNLGIISGIKANRKKISEILQKNQGMFNTKILKDLQDNLTPYTPEKKRDTLLMSIALIHNISSKSSNLKTEYYELYNSINGL